MGIKVSWKGKKAKQEPAKNMAKSSPTNPVVKKSSPAFEKGGIMNAKPKHPAVRKQSVASKVAAAVKGAVKGAVAGKTKQHPAMRANERGTANIAANRTASKVAPKQHPAMRPKKK